jgi:Protein of unknown function (DUF3309)
VTRVIASSRIRKIAHTLNAISEHLIPSSASEVIRRHCGGHSPSWQFPELAIQSGKGEKMILLIILIILIFGFGYGGYRAGPGLGYYGGGGISLILTIVLILLLLKVI